VNVWSLFTGIGGLDLGLKRAGLRIVRQCEADPYRRSVLRRHWPDIPCYEDVCEVDSASRASRDGAGRRALGGVADGASGNGALGSPAGVDLLCGGFPCQDLSVAGRRAGLDGARSSLFFEFARIAESLRPRWLLVENVPGLLSSHGGRDFAVLLATLAELGYGVCWRVLDSRFFGVPQRRRRVFVVGHLGAASAEPFLPFLEGGEGHPAASGETREDVAAPLGSSARNGRESGGSRFDLDNETYVPVTAKTVSTGGGTWRGEDHDTYVTHSLTSGGRGVTEDGTGRGTPLIAPALHGFAHGTNGQFDKEVRGTMAALGAGVRRLTPTECCRLQGFPDDWLGPPNEPPDSPRYAALGDAVTVNVAHWIGLKIMEAEHVKARSAA